MLLAFFSAMKSAQQNWYVHLFLYLRTPAANKAHLILTLSRRFDPGIQGGDGVLQDFHYEYSGFRAAPRDPAGVSGVWEETEVKGKKIIVNNGQRKCWDI